MIILQSSYDYTKITLCQSYNQRMIILQTSCDFITIILWLHYNCLTIIYQVSYNHLMASSIILKSSCSRLMIILQLFNDYLKITLWSSYNDYSNDEGILNYKKLTYYSQNNANKRTVRSFEYLSWVGIPENTYELLKILLSNVVFTRV